MYEITMTVYNDDGTIKEVEVSKAIEIGAWFDAQEAEEDYKTLNAMSAMPEYFNDQLDVIE